jgi:hypothetical protein
VGEPDKKVEALFDRFLNLYTKLIASVLGFSFQVSGIRHQGVKA